MTSYNVLPELVLSKKCARYLLTRNAGEKAMFRKKSFLIEKAKTKEEKAFQREKQLVIQRQLKTQEIQTTQTHGLFNAASKTISRIEAGENKWEVNSDTTLYVKQRRKQEFLPSSKTSVCSSHESIFSVSTDNRGDAHLTVISTKDGSRRLRSLRCVLPPI